MASTPPMTPTGEEIQQNLAGAHLLSLLRSTSNKSESEQSRQSALPTAPGVHSHLQIELDAKRGQYQPIFSNRPLTIPSPIARIFDVPAPLAAVVGPRLSAGGDDKSATLPSTADDRELFRLPSNPWGPSPVPTPTGSSVAPTPTNGHTNPGRAFEWDTTSNHGNVYAPSLMTDIPHGMFPMHGHQPFPPQAYMHNPEAMSLHHQSWQFMQLHMQQQQQQVLASMQQHGWVHPPPGFNPPGFGGSPIRTPPPPLDSTCRVQ
ncbi:hypothetical protein CEUSTIGMA_g12287.t1 [Chlamydomonas eustigma]|uniref:Uncharacterized protein n=1 Tax=Chlamydomonas eustigma TaxID=1157962 RepID=A0A250XP96_9CHLO|nr:hypothetical protein CEUSTIGMA_g12287.t1 [Chlamydomonas eustigma]|eukprot:GAX84866.1 hypothetical protein CEUSTIGMA_g12287.t1 [Chlamydomonas eustigma]